MNHFSTRQPGSLTPFVSGALAIALAFSVTNAQRLQASGAELQSKVAAQLEGKPAPDFSLETLEGNQVSLADLKGDVVVLDFWASWCGPCRQSLPELNTLHQEKAAEGVKVFAVNLKEDKEKVKAFLDSKNLSLPVLLDKDGSVAEKFAVTGIPQTVVIAKDGTVQKVFVGAAPGLAEELRQQVDAANNRPTLG